MSKETIQQQIEILRNKTEEHSIPPGEVADIFTGLNNEKIQTNGSNLTNENVQSLQNVLGINQNSSNRLVQIGEVSAEDFTVTIDVPEDDVNKWVIKNANYQKSIVTYFEINELEDEDKFRIDSIYANKFNNFTVVQGEESVNPIRPIVTDENLVFVTDVFVTPAGLNVNPEIDLSGFKEKAEDGWKTISNNPANTDFLLTYTDKRTNFRLTTFSPSSGSKKIIGVQFSEKTNRAIELKVFNDTLGNITLEEFETDGLLKGVSTGSIILTVPPKGLALLKYNPETDVFEILNITSSKTPISYGSSYQIPFTNTEANGFSYSDRVIAGVTTGGLAHGYIITSHVNGKSAGLRGDRFSIDYNLLGVSHSLNFNYDISGAVDGTTYTAVFRAKNGTVAYLDDISSEIKDISANYTILESDRGKTLRILANVIITIPTGLSANFEIFGYVHGNFTATFQNGSGFTAYAPFGMLLKQGLTAMFKRTTNSTGILTGNLVSA